MILSLGSTIISILAFLFALGLIILIHEGGHFFFARRVDILCREYAFGMGPQLIKTKKGETVYALRAFPIGGFCAIAGEEMEEDPLDTMEEVKLLIEDGVVTKIILDNNNDIYNEAKIYKIIDHDIFDANDTGHLFIKVLENEEEVEYSVHPQAMFVTTKVIKNPNLSREKQIDKYTTETQIAPHNRTLNSKSLGARAMVMFGGPLMNFLLAIVVFFLSALITGFADMSSTEISEISEGTAAYVAGLQEDDIILELSAGSLSSGTLEDWNDLSEFMKKYKSDESINDVIKIKYMRDGVEYETYSQPMVVIYSISMVQDINDTNNVKIGSLATGSIAYKAGLREGDIILTVQTGEETPVSVTTWKQVYNIFSANEDGIEMTLTVNRNGETIENIKVNPYSKELFEKTQSVGITDILLGVSPKAKFNLGKSIVYSFTETWASLVNMVHTLEMLFFSDEVGINQLSGPVGIYSMTSQAAAGGFGSLLQWVGFLSVNVGFLNLLPVPALDGGRLVFLAYEAITKKRPNEKVETILITATMLLLFGLIIFVSYNDILRLLGVK